MYFNFDQFMENLKPFLIHLLNKKTKTVLNYIKEYLLWNIVIAFWLLLGICAAVFATAFLLWDFNIVETFFTRPLVIRIFILIVLFVSLICTVNLPNYFFKRIKKYKQKLEQND